MIFFWIFRYHIFRQMVDRATTENQLGKCVPETGHVLMKSNSGQSK